MAQARDRVRQVPDVREEVLRLLGMLARRGALVRAAAGDDGRVEVEVASAGEAGRTQLGTVGRPALEAAAAKGWVGPSDGGAGALALTAAGWRTLREARRRLAHLRASERDADPGQAAAGRPAVNPSESPLAWLRSRRDGRGRPLVDDAQFAAGERLRAEMTFAGLTPRVTMAWSGVAAAGGSRRGAAVSAQELADNVVAARSRVGAALRAVGAEHADILIDVCGHLKGLEVIAAAEGWPGRAAKIVLQRALTALARHYGLIADVGFEQRLSARLRHWGAEGYRPALSRWARPGQVD